MSKKLPDQFFDLVNSVAYVVARRFKHIIDRQDLEQEAYAWGLGKAESIGQMYELEDKEEIKVAERRLGWQMKRFLERYARREKALKSGYQTNDEVFYETYTIAQMLEVVIKAIEADIPFEQGVHMVDDGQPKKPSAPAESGNLLAMLIDIKKAYLALEQNERLILKQRYLDSFTLQQMAEFWECAISTADRRCERALSKLQDQLGGPTPWS